jgi:hypothetical protein
MRSSISRPLKIAAWIYAGPFLAIGVLAAMVLGLAALAVALQLLSLWLKHAV